MFPGNMGFTVLQLEEVAVAPRPVPAFDTTEGGGSAKGHPRPRPRPRPHLIPSLFGLPN
jgi:hypothetical protein